MVAAHSYLAATRSWKSLSCGAAQGFEREVVNDQQRHAHELLELTLIEACGAGRMQFLDQIGLRDEQHVMSLMRSVKWPSAWAMWDLPPPV